MGLSHYFIQINKNNYFPGFHKNITIRHGMPESGQIGIIDTVKIPDNLILYVLDTLKWVPAFNPATNKGCCGINYYGVTLFENDNIQILNKIFNAWIGLFNNAPQEIVLRGSFILNENNEGNYEKIPFKKDSLLNIFNDMVRITEDMNKNVILHLGI